MVQTVQGWDAPGGKFSSSGADLCPGVFMSTLVYIFSMTAWARCKLYQHRFGGYCTKSVWRRITQHAQVIYYCFKCTPPYRVHRFARAPLRLPIHIQYFSGALRATSPYNRKKLSWLWQKPKLPVSTHTQPKSSYIAFSNLRLLSLG